MEASHPNYLEYRCKECNKLLFKGVLIDSEIEVKCKRCNGLSIFQGESKEKYICWKTPCSGRIGAK